jgi:phospholipase C
MLSYDGSGGWYDNVAPPQVDKLGYGMRVPALLVSSYSRPGFIDHTAYDYTSALKFIEQNWGVRALASRDASATSIASAFDFQAGPQPPDLAFNRTAVARPPVGSVSVVYWLYGAALTLVLAVIGYAAISSRRSERRPLPSPPASAHEEPVGASR